MTPCHRRAIWKERAAFPLLIEDDDGTRMDRRTIIDALRVGMREQLGD
jgi:hypothetical protein